MSAKTNAKSNIVSYLDGPYAPVTSEDHFDQLEVIGELPRELHGMFVQNSPNPRFAPSPRYHWFDGDGMIHAVHLENGRASYRNRYIQTRDFQTEGAAGGAQWGGLLDPIRDTPRGRDKDTANTDLEWAQGRLLALWWLGGEPYEIDVPSLETRGVAEFAKGLPCGVASHPKTDRHTGEMVFFDYSPYEAPFMHYGLVGADGKLKHVVAIDVPGPRLFHDIAITEHYSVLMDLPMLWRQDKLAQGKRAVAFDDTLPSRFGILPRAGGDVRWFELPPCYIYHSVNAWEEGDEVVMWACRITNPIPRVPHEQEPEVPRLYFLRLTPTMWEWRFNLKTGQATERQMDDRLTEFPRINDLYMGRKNRFSYNPRLARKPTLLFDGFFKYDLETMETLTWEAPDGWFASEAVFAAHPNAESEDHGWLTCMGNSLGGESALIVLNALDMTEVCRIPVPRRVPMGFHAAWVPGAEM